MSLMNWLLYTIGKLVFPETQEGIPHILYYSTRNIIKMFVIW